MRTGLVIGIHADGPESPAPSWAEIAAQVQAADELGFHSVVLEDALFFGEQGMWESISVAGAVAASTEQIAIGHSVINPPLRPPALIAKAAETLDEISGGRYVLGIGAGNTPDDYAAFGIPAEPRVSRFEETIEIVAGLLKRGAVDFEGTHHSALDARLYPRGPRVAGPPIVIAASGERMVDITARLADGWNWFCAATSEPATLRPILERLDEACARHGRRPRDVVRTVDVYSIDLLGLTEADRPDHVLTGSVDEIVERLAGFASIGINEVRLDLLAPHGDRVAAVQACAPIAIALDRV